MNKFQGKWVFVILMVLVFNFLEGGLRDAADPYAR